jgi:hypothetical protein
MELSADQLRAVASGEAVPITVNQTPCVLIRADIYDRVQAMLDIEAAYPLIDETFQEGWAALDIADYGRYDELKRS